MGRAKLDVAPQSRRAGGVGECCVLYYLSGPPSLSLSDAQAIITQANGCG